MTIWLYINLITLKPVNSEIKKTSPFRNLDRTCKLFEEVFTREKPIEKKNLFLKTCGLREGSN
jgi:hypothetical protein